MGTNMRRRLAAMTCLVLLGTSCNSADPSRNADSSHDADTGTDGELPTVDLGDEVVLTSALIPFDDCDGLLDYLRDEYSARIGPWGFDGGGWGWPEPLMMEDSLEMDMADSTSGTDDAAPAQTAPVEGVDFSGTNVQEAGVDEADIIKTDGRRIYALSQGRLVVVDAATRQATGSVEIAEGWSAELFIDGDDLLVIVSTSQEHHDQPETVMQRIGVTGGTPSVLDTLRVEGSYLSARSVGGVARVITRFDPHHNFPFVYPRNEAGEQAAEEANRAAVRNSALDDWLPHFSTGGQRASTGSLLTPCERAHAPSVFSGFGVTTVMSVPVSGEFDPAQSTSVIAPGDIVYASPASLYVATLRWLDGDEFDDDEDGWRGAWLGRRTSVHRFAIGAADAAAYVASGDVLGVVRDQFSLSEHDGHLRVVTSVGGPWDDDAESYVRVLRQEADRLVEVGSVGNIGWGEQVQSVRFVGDIGYVVTFRQIDPFYTIDLSEPTDPRILGELKIPGFSSYLHPISDDLVLGVGSDADLDGRITGSKVSLFDVSDLSAPLEVATWTVPDGWNDIGWDHRAFLWWAPERLAVVPVTVWGDFAGAVVLRVDDASIQEVGRVSHDDGSPPLGTTECRELAVDDLPAGSSGDIAEALAYAAESDGRVIACDPSQAAVSGFHCWPEQYLRDEAAALGVLRPGEGIFTCWPDYTPQAIVRTMVIGNELWTLGSRGWGFDYNNRSRLEVNDLLTLERLAGLDL